MMKFIRHDSARQSHTRRGLCLSLIMLLVTSHSQAAEQDDPLLVFAAASLTNVLQDLGRQYQQQTGQRVTFSFASSAALAKQIDAGANADVFIAADNDWMDYLQGRSAILSASRRVIAGNQLVLIAPADSTARVTMQAPLKLLPILGNGRLAIGDPASVPAGKYAQAALTALRAWPEVSTHLVLGDSVRTTLNFVSRGEAPLGIVYATDALIDARVKVLRTFPANSHEPIVYPAAITRKGATTAARFMSFLTSADARAVFTAQGFLEP